jgi:hypothetical protein
LFKIAGQTHPTGYNMGVEKTVKVFASFEDADAADACNDAANGRSDSAIRIQFSF